MVPPDLIGTRGKVLHKRGDGCVVIGRDPAKAYRLTGCEIGPMLPKEKHRARSVRACVRLWVCREEGIGS
jgi:hypothetical protein